MNTNSYKNMLESGVNFEKAKMMLDKIVKHVTNYTKLDTNGEFNIDTLYTLVQTGLSQTLVVSNNLMLESLAISAKRIADTLENGLKDITEQED